MSAADQLLSVADVLPWDHPVPPTLYKYLAPQRLDVLANCSVVFSHRSAFSDDHELSPDFATFGTEQQIWKWARTYNRNLTDLIPATSRLSIQQLVKLVATDPGLIRHAVESAKQGMKSPDLFGIFCLTEAGDSERMWTEYADSSCGFVVAFDTTCAAFDRMKQPGRLGKVTYSDEPVGSFLALALEGEAGAIFFRKRLPYSFEREWRSVRAFSRLRLGPGDRYFADFSPECVREILVRPPCAIKGELQELLRADERFRHVRLINGR